MSAPYTTPQFDKQKKRQTFEPTHLIRLVHLVRHLAEAVANATEEPKDPSARQRRCARRPGQVPVKLEEVDEARVSLKYWMFGNAIQKSEPRQNMASLQLSKADKTWNDQPCCGYNLCNMCIIFTR